MKGVNLRERNGNILIGIKTDEFFEQLKAHTDAKGWANFVITQLPVAVQGHTLNMLPDRKRPKDGSTKGE